MGGILIRATWVWLLLVIVAIGNGLLRDQLLVRLVGNTALPISGITLSLAVLLVAYLTLPRIGQTDDRGYLAIGLYWVTLTLAFELLFGHFVVGRDWNEILQVFNVARGDLFLLVLICSAVAPWLAARLRRRR